MNRPCSPRFRWISLFVLLVSASAAASAQTPAALPASPSTLPLPAVSATADPAVESATAPSALREYGSSLADPTGLAPTASADGPELASSVLPDAPTPAEPRIALPGSFTGDAPNQATPTVAPKLTKYIPAGWTAQSITAHDKVLLGLRDLYSPLNFIAMVASAGYEHVLNGEPNYGTDRGAFGERLGAAAIRESTQGLFTDSLFAPMLHEDPRYYVQGPSHGFFYRAAYAATRPLITRTDGGHSSVNGALLLGYAGSSALSYTYYPAINQNFHDTAATFGSSLGGAALGYFVSEFSDDVLKAVHLRKK